MLKSINNKSSSTIRFVISFSCILLLLPLVGCSLTNSKGLRDRGKLAQAEPVEALAFQADTKFGEGLSSSDRKSLGDAEKSALDSGEVGFPNLWKGGDEKVTGTVTVSALFRVGKSNCRRFSHKLTNGGKIRNVSGTACQREGSDWKLVV